MHIPLHHTTQLFVFKSAPKGSPSLLAGVLVERFVKQLAGGFDSSVPSALTCCVLCLASAKYGEAKR